MLGFFILQHYNNIIKFQYPNKVRENISQKFDGCCHTSRVHEIYHTLRHSSNNIIVTIFEKIFGVFETYQRFSHSKYDTAPYRGRTKRSERKHNEIRQIYSQAICLRSASLQILLKIYFPFNGASAAWILDPFHLNIIMFMVELIYYSRCLTLRNEFMFRAEE